MNSEALARAVKEARGSRSQHEIVRRAEERGHRISLATYRNVEAARHTTYRATILTAVDAGLDWALGTAQAILDGKPPLTRVDSVEEADDIGARLARVEQQLRLAAGEVHEITALDAMAVVLSRLDDHQYECVSRAVTSDPRFQPVS